MRDRAATERFWKEAFGAREMAHPGPRAIAFITFLNLGPGEGSIMISPPGPFEGMAVGDPGRWRREVVPVTPDLPPAFGVHWVGVRTGSLTVAVSRLKAAGIRAREGVRLPAEPLARAALVLDPDDNLVAVVERAGATGFGFDHLQLLVGSVDENERFFRDVLAGEVGDRRSGTTVMRVGGAAIVLSEPEGLGLRRPDVQPRDPSKFRYGIDHISFLYADARTAAESARAKGYRFPLEPRVLTYFGEPTVYTFGFTLSPDGLQCEMLTEEGRRGPRTRLAGP